jgi:hypothetical protein
MDVFSWNFVLGNFENRAVYEIITKITDESDRPQIIENNTAQRLYDVHDG